MYSKTETSPSTSDYWDKLKQLAERMEQADRIIIGAGAGLSTAAGLTYSGERFNRYFGDFQNKYGITDMYSGGFYPFTSLEEYWAWWSRHIYYNRYTDPPRPLYAQLWSLLRERDYFVITTNVDHCFQRAGFDPKRLFYTQGDYGLWQCAKPCSQHTYANAKQVLAMMEQQVDMRIPSELIPYCPLCQAPMTMNLRSDERFVEPPGWHRAQQRYLDFIEQSAGQSVLYLELGVGGNTPGWIKYPFWQYTADNPQASYASINLQMAVAPQSILERSILIRADIGQVLQDLEQLFGA